MVLNMAEWVWHKKGNPVNDRKWFKLFQLRPDFGLGGHKVGRARSLQIRVDIGEIAGKGKGAHLSA